MVVGSEKKNLVVLFGEAILALSSILGAFSVIVKLRIIFGNLRCKLYCVVIYPTSKRAKYISILISSRDLTNGVLFDPLAGLGWAEWAGLGAVDTDGRVTKETERLNYDFLV